jgi:hypothetical protein
MPLGPCPATAASANGAFPKERSGNAAPECAARRPTETALYGIVRDHLESFLAHARETYDRSLPHYVEQAFRSYLECGVFAHGFMRLHCDDCRRDLRTCPAGRVVDARTAPWLRAPPTHRAGRVGDVLGVLARHG